MHLALLAACAVVGWIDIEVGPARSGAVNAPWQQTLNGLDGPSPRTQDTLKRYDLESRYRRDPEGVLLHLENYARRSPEAEVVYALAELSWVEAQRLSRKRKPESLDYYLDTVAYAYDYLFEPELASGRSMSDPRFRLAMDLYNGGLDQVIRAAQSRGGTIEPGETITLKQHGREYHVQVNLEQTPWRPEDIQQLLPCSDFEVSGLATRSYQYGLGVPLVGVRHKPETEPGAPSDRIDEPLLPAEMAYPLTAFLRPNSRLRDPDANVQQVRESTLYLLDPVECRSVSQGGISLGIESDLTTPLAYMWSRTDLSALKWAGFLRPGSATERTGLMLLRPYQEDRIPVVMIHGLMSSPLAWLPMLNELMRDPQIQKRYQFFLFVYPTGVPIPIAASQLRAALADARRRFDPDDASPTFSRMVLLGHSMGGLLAHAMAVDSGDQFWHLNSYRRFDDLIGPADLLGEFAHYTFFEAQPCVDRVVFLATPHRGSDLANRAIGRLGSSLITTPDQYSSLLDEMVKNNPEAFNSRRFRRLPTSIDSLELDAPVLLALLAMQPRAGAQFHSIIGAKYPGPLATTTDGVVPYRSSHFEAAQSELVVHSDHAVQADAEAIREVHRILTMHLAAVDAPAVELSTPTRGTADVRRVQHTPPQAAAAAAAATTAPQAPNLVQPPLTPPLEDRRVP